MFDIEKWQKKSELQEMLNINQNLLLGLLAF